MNPDRPNDTNHEFARILFRRMRFIAPALLIIGGLFAAVYVPDLARLLMVIFAIAAIASFFLFHISAKRADAHISGETDLTGSAPPTVPEQQSGSAFDNR